MDLSRAFYGVLHDLLLMAYDVDECFLCYLYSYILNGKKCLQINNINSDFLNVI